jgi:hypothetical protein
MATSTLRADQGNGSYILKPIVDTVIEFKFAQPPICAALDAMPMTMLWARLSHQNSKLRRWNKNDSITAQDSDRSCFTTCCERIGGRLFSSFSAVRREGISSSIVALTGLAFEAMAARCPSIVFDGPPATGDCRWRARHHQFRCFAERFPHICRLASGSSHLLFLLEKIA